MSNPFDKYLEASRRQNRKLTGSLANLVDKDTGEFAYRDISLASRLGSVNDYITSVATPPEKSVGDHIGDTAVDATKAAMTLAQTGISALDLGAYSLGGLASAVQQVGHEIAPNAIPQPKVPEYGQITKVLDDGLGFNIGKAKQTLGELGYSDIRKAQEQELYTGYTQEQIDAFNNQWANQYNLQYQDLANKGANALQLEGFKAKFNDNYKKAYTDFMGKNQTSMDKSLGENLSIMGKAFGTVLDNPSLGVGAAIESTGYLLPSLAVARGVAALQGAARANAAERAIAAGIGEGLVSALALNEQMRGNSATGTIDGTKVAAGFGGGALTGLIGGVSNKLGSRFGLDDIDSLDLGTQAKGFSVTRPVLATGQEAGEEFLQGFGESIIPNIAEGKDPLQGLAQELALGTAAGGVMGGATNARGLVSGAGNDLISGLNKIRGKVEIQDFAVLSDLGNENYDAAKAFNTQVTDLQSKDETVRKTAEENVFNLKADLKGHIGALTDNIKNTLTELSNPNNGLSEKDVEAKKAKAQSLITIKRSYDQQLDNLLEAEQTLAQHTQTVENQQYTPEQAKADIATLNQEPVNSTVWSNQDTDIPVQVMGEPETHEDGTQYSKVSVTQEDGTVIENYVPTAELKTIQDTSAQEQAISNITKHFSRFDSNELVEIAKSPYLTEEQRSSLRQLSEFKMALAAASNSDDVSAHIVNGYKGKTPSTSHRGLNQYTELVNTAMASKNEDLLNRVMDDLSSFAESHAGKAQAAQQALTEIGQGKYKEALVSKTNDGVWGITPIPDNMVGKVKRNIQAGELLIDGYSNKPPKGKTVGFVTKLNNEASMIRNHYDTLSNIVSSFGLQASKPTVTPPVTVEALREANKPVVPSNSTDGITSAIIQLNKYNKSGTPLTIDNVTPEALQTLQAKVSSAFEIGAVNQQTYDDVTKDIATLQQYLSSAKPNKQNQEVSKTNTTTQPSTKHNTQDTSNITDNQKTGIWEESQLSNLKRVIDSFVTINEITSKEYMEGKGNIHERAWALVKTAYNSTAKHITELMAKGITTVEDIENLTEQLNKLYEYANQSIDLNSDRASLDKLTLNIDSLATVLFSNVDSKLIDEYLKQKEEKVARRGDKLLTDRDGNKSFDGRTTEYVFNAPHLQNNKPSSANAVNNTSEQTQVPSTNTALSTYVNHSGGAKGSDSAWGDIGAVYGVTSNHYYKDKTPKGNVQITKEQYEEGLLKAKEAAKALGRNWSSKSYVQGLLARNWQQVKNADAIFAIAELDGKYVKGGTGYAVAMAVDEGKPIYVFDQSKNSWFKHTGTGWQKTDTPTLTPNFAGIGTREINAKGVQAIKDVYAKTQQDNKSVTTPVSGSNTQATKPTVSQEVVTPTTSTQTEPTAAVVTEPTKDTAQAEEAVKQWGYLGELLEDEDVDSVFKQELEKILKLKADRASKGDPTFVSFNDLLTFDGGIEYFTRLAKNDPNITKLAKAAYKLRDLMGIVQHHRTLENYLNNSISAADLKEYINKYPQLKSIFEEVRKQKPKSLVHAVEGDIQEAKDVLSTEMDKLISLVGLLYIQAAFEKGQQYLVDTNYADLKEVIFPFTLGLLSNKHLGHLQKNRVVGYDSVGIRKLITPTELAFLDKVDGIPVGELPKEDFEMVKALVQNAVNGYFNQYEVLEYPRRPEKVYSDIVHNSIVEHLPKEGFTLENHTPEEVINGAVPQSFTWDFKKQTSTQTSEDVASTEATQSEPKDEVSDSTVNKHLTTEDVKQILIERYGEDVVNVLIEKGLLTIHQSLPNGFNTKGAKFSKNVQSRDAAIREAREAVRELLVKLNFKFVESPNLDIGELERIASKYITGLHNDDETFLKEAAKALSYALYHDINGGDVKSVDKNIPRTEIETVILYWLKNGTLPHNAPSLWKRIIFTLKKLLSVFNGKLYESVSEKLEDTINKIITGESFSYTPKAGYAKLNFQREMDNNPNAVNVLKSLVKSGQPFVLTGSVAYADQVPVYRDPHKPLHDVDLLFPQGKAEEVYQWFKKGDPNTWGDIVKLYEFTRDNKKVIGTAVVPAGYKIVNVKSFWNAQAKRPQRSYDVYSEETNTKVGSYFFLQGETEKFEGIAGITVDIMESDTRKAVQQQFTDSEGKTLTIEVSSYEGGFAAKLEMLREKDINDFKLVIPRDVTTQAKQSISANNKVEGFYQDGKVHLIADNLTAETVVATLVHELSGHLGFQELLDKDTYLALLNRFKQLVAEGDEVAIAAKKRAEAATDNPSEQESEYLPYLLSEYLTAKAKAKKGKLKSLFEAVVNGLKTALSELFASSNIPTTISNDLITKMTTSDIVYLAERMVGGISDTVNQSTQSEQSVENKDELESIEAKSGLVHRIASKLVNKLLTVKFELDSILNATSDVLNEKQAAYVSGLLKTLIGLNPTVRVGFYSDLGKIHDTDVRGRLPGAKAHTRNNIIYIDLKNDAKTDIRELLLHEYHHTVTIATLDSLDPSSNIHKALAEVDAAIRNFLNTSPNVSEHVLGRLRYMTSDFKELMTVGVTEPRVIARLRTIMINDTQSAYDVIWKQSIAVMKSQNPKLFTLEVENTLNDLAQIGRGDTPGVSNSSTQSTDTPTGTSENNESQDTGGDTTTASVSGASNTGADIEQTTNQAEVEEGTISVLQGVTEEVRQEERSKKLYLQNIIKAYFRQIVEGNNPLTSVNNFMGLLKNAATDLSTYLSEWLSDKTRVTNAQIKQLKHFQQFHEKMRQEYINLIYQAQTVKSFTNTRGELYDTVHFLFPNLGDLKKPSHLVPENERLEKFVELNANKLTVFNEELENTLTALSLAAYSYMIVNGNTVFNTDDNLRAILRLRDKEYIPGIARTLLTSIGNEHPYAIREVGKVAVQALGLRVMDDADTTLQDRLESSVGNLVITALHNKQYVVIEELNNPQVIYQAVDASKNYIRGSIAAQEEEQSIKDNRPTVLTFVRPNFKAEYITKNGNKYPKIDYQNKQAVNEDIETITALAKDSGTFLSRLFKVDVGYTTPTTLQPEKFNQESIAGTKAKVSKLQKDSLTEAQKLSFSMRKGTVAVVKTLKGIGTDSKFLKELLGIWIDDDVLERTHITERDGLKSKAENEWRELENGLTWAGLISTGNDEYTEFYDEQEVAQNQRMGYLSRLFNTQTSQIHRAMAGKTTFNVEVDLNNTEDNLMLDRFYLAVGEGIEKMKGVSAKIQEANIGYKLFTPDKVAMQDYVAALKEFLQGSMPTNAVAAMVKVLNQESISSEEQQHIKAFVDAGKLGVQSLQSLIALAELEIAKQDMSKPFITNVGLSSDGVNHGVATANVLLNSANDTMLQQVGLFTDDTANMQEAYANGVEDYYVTFGRAIKAKLLALIENGDIGTVVDNAVIRLFTMLSLTEENIADLRKLAKNWTVPFNYAAGEAGLKAALGRAFIANIYSQMNTIANAALDLKAKDKNYKSSLEYATLLNQTDVLAKQLHIIHGRVNLGLPEELNNYKFTAFEEEVLIKAVSDVHGKAAWEATQDLASDYINKREAYSFAHKVGFELYNIVRQALINEALMRKRAELINITGKQFEGYFGLSKEELRRIDEILKPIHPNFNSALSSASNNREAGIFLIDEEKSREAGTARKNQSMFFQQGNTNGKYSNRTRTTGAIVKEEVPSGKKGFALAIQSIDAYVATLVQAVHSVVNAHDAIITDIKNYVSGVKAQNEAFLQAMSTYHLGLEHAEMLVRLFKGLDAVLNGSEPLLEDGAKNEALKTEVRKVADAIIKELLEGETDRKKDYKTGKPIAIQKEGFTQKLLNMMSATSPEAARALVNNQNKTLKDVIQAFVIAAINNDIAKLTKLLELKTVHQFAGEGGAIKLTAKHKQVIKDNIIKLQEQSKFLLEKLEAPASTFSEVTAKESKDPLHKFLEANKNKAIGKVKLIAQLRSILENQKLAAEDKTRYERELAVLEAIESLIPDNLTLTYQDTETNEFGDYDPVTDTITVKANSTITPPTLLLIHELLHSATSKRITALEASMENKQPDDYSNAEKALAQLKKLYKEVLQESKRLGLKELNRRIYNIHEFIAEGLSSPTVQGLLKKIAVDTANRKQIASTSKWRKFVDLVAGLFNFKEKQVNALAAFATDVGNFLSQLESIQLTSDLSNSPSKHNSAYPEPEDTVNNMSSLEIMRQLPTDVSSDFNEYLDKVITEDIGQLYANDLEAMARINEIQSFNSSAALDAGFNLSPKEDKVQQSVELSVATYMRLNAGGLNVSEINKVFANAKAKFTVKDFHNGDWNSATKLQKQLAKQKHDFVFDTTKQGYLPRFVSMALASEEFNSMLDVRIISPRPTQSKSWFDTVATWFNYVMSWLSSQYVKSKPLDNVNKQIKHLVSNLVKLDIKSRQQKIALHERAWNKLGVVTNYANNKTQSVRNYIGKGNFFRNSKFLPLRVIGAAAVLDPKALSDTLPKLALSARNRHFPNTRLTEAWNVLLEASSKSTLLKAMERLIRQANHNARERQNLTNKTKKEILSWFKEPLDKQQHAAITYTLLRADLQSLLSQFSVDEVFDLISDHVTLGKAIDKYASTIAKQPHGNDMVNAAKQLGEYMATTKGGKGLVKSALGIAAGLGTQYQIKRENVNQQLVKDIDVLVSLYALLYTPETHKKETMKVYATNKEAMQALIYTHQHFAKEALKDFIGNEFSVNKGWLPEITNPYREIRYATSVEQRNLMESQGWKYLETLKKDPLDTSAETKYMMVHKDAGYQRIVSGAVDLGDGRRKGTEVFGVTDKGFLQAVQNRYQDASKREAIPYSQFDPSKQESGLIASYDSDGVIIGFNYEMAGWIRDSILERNNNFADLLGAYAGNNFYKPEKSNQSRLVADVLFEDYKNNYAKNPNAYIKLSSKSTDPKLVEMWRMLPHDFKQRAESLYGKGQPIMLRNEAFNIAFGFKKWSISTVFDKTLKERNFIERLFVQMLEGVFGNKAGGGVAKLEHWVQELSTKVKDFIVIRTVSVLWYNIVSNAWMLMVNGINPVTMLKDWAFAITNVRAYQKANAELLQLQTQELAGKATEQTTQRIGMLKQQIQANPLMKYIEAGLLSSIVEDVAVQSADYTYATEFKQKVDKATDWIPSPIKTAGAWLVISPSTSAYQLLATTTQLSDFVSKYSLAKHLEKQGMGFQEAITEASQTFINYDVPTSRGMQYMNDMGLFMFTKFFLRIQAVLAKLMDKKAASVIAQHLAVENLLGMQGILDPLAPLNIGWPIDDSVANLPSTFMDIAPVNAGLGLAGF